MAEQQRVESVRRPFQEEVAKRCTEFARDLLTLVPELECVAIVPSFEPVQDRVASGFIIGREGQPRTPAEIVHVSAQLHLTLKSLMDRSFATLQAVDKEMAKQAQEIRDKSATLAELDRRIAEHQSTLATGTGGGDPPNGPPAS